jgi:hypothetical protein
VHEDGQRTPRAEPRSLSDIPLCFTVSTNGNGGTGMPVSPGLRLPPSLITRHIPLPIQNLPSLPPISPHSSDPSAIRPVRPSIRSVPTLSLVRGEPQDHSEGEMDSDIDEDTSGGDEDNDSEDERNSAVHRPPAISISPDSTADSSPALSEHFGRLPGKEMPMPLKGKMASGPTPRSGSVSQSGARGDYFGIPRITTTVASPECEFIPTAAFILSVQADRSLVPQCPRLYIIVPMEKPLKRRHASTTRGHPRLLQHLTVTPQPSQGLICDQVLIVRLPARWLTYGLQAI